MSYHKEIFNDFTLTESEDQFVENIKNMQGNSMSHGDVHISLSNFYLAKQIEKSGKSSDKSARVMGNLTWAIAIFTALQGIKALVDLYCNTP